MNAEPGNAEITAKLQYARLDLVSRSGVFTSVGILTICIGVLSLIINALIGFESLQFSSRRMIAQANFQRTVAAGNARAAALKAARQAATTRQSNRALTPAEIKGVIATINQLLLTPNGRHSLSGISDGQKRTISNLLCKNSQQVIDPDVGLNTFTRTSAQFIRASFDSNQVLHLIIRHGPFVGVFLAQIDAGGNILSMTVMRLQGMPLVPPIPVPALIAPNTQLQKSQQLSNVISVALAAIHITLAILLVVAGICLLARTLAGIRLLWIYLALKLSASIIGATDLLPNWLGSTVSLDIPFGTPIVLIGCLYPIALLIILRSPTFRFGNLQNSQGGQGRLSALGPISVFVACVTAVIGGLYEIGAISWAMNNEHLGWFAAAAFVPDLASAVLLVVAGSLLMRSSPRGVQLHWLYVCIKIVTAVFSMFVAASLMGDDDYIPTFIVELPLLVTLIYPVFLIFLLPRKHDPPTAAIQMPALGRLFQLKFSR